MKLANRNSILAQNLRFYTRIRNSPAILAEFNKVMRDRGDIMTVKDIIKEKLQEIDRLEFE